MCDLRVLIRLDILSPAFRTLIIATTVPHIRPLCAVLATTIVVKELSLEHFSPPLDHLTPHGNFLARCYP